MSETELKPMAEIAGYVVACPHCGKENDVYASDAGEDMTCQYTNCEKEFQVPDQPRPAGYDDDYVEGGE